jgi:hypothetical protein
MGLIDRPFTPTFTPGKRVEILVSTGYGTITGRIVEQFDEWWAIDPSSAHAAGHLVKRPVRWIQVDHIVAVNETEEQ